MSVNVSVLASGSSGNCVYITDGKVNILVDAGLSGKEIARRLKKSRGGSWEYRCHTGYP